MGNPFRRSLALRATLIIVLASACGVLMTLLLAQRLVTDRLEHEARAIEQLAEKRIANRFVSEVGLVRFRIGMLGAALEDGLALVANDERVRQAMRVGRAHDAESGLRDDLSRLGFSDGILVDYRLRLIARPSDGKTPRPVERILRDHPLADTLEDLLDQATSHGGDGFRRIIVFDTDMTAALDTDGQAAGLVVASVIRSETNDVLGLLLAVRPFRKSEPILTDLAQTSGIGLSLNVAASLVTAAGDISGRDFTQVPPHGVLMRNEAAGKVAHCASLAMGLTLCLCRPISDVTAFRDEMAAIGIAQSQRTTLLLLASGLIGLFALALVAFHVARWFTRPLIEITDSVDSIAGGDFRRPIRHAEREDEMGRIARAIAAMQGRLEERDRMRAEMIRIDAINQRRLALTDALKRFEQSATIVMHDLSSMTSSLSASEAVLARASSEAAEQVERIAQSSLATASSARAVNGATLQLSEGLSDINEHNRRTREAVTSGRERLAAVHDRLGHAGDAARAAEDDISALQEAVSGFAAAALQDTLRLASGLPDQRSRIACTTEIADRISQRLSTLAADMAESTDTLDALGAELDNARKASGEIAVSAMEQGAATRTIASGLAETSVALDQLTSAAETLRNSLSGAHGATRDFVQAAHRVIEDTRIIDETVRSFVRDAAA